MEISKSLMTIVGEALYKKSTRKHVRRRLKFVPLVKIELSDKTITFWTCNFNDKIKVLFKHFLTSKDDLEQTRRRSRVEQKQNITAAAGNQAWFVQLWTVSTNHRHGLSSSEPFQPITGTVAYLLTVSSNHRHGLSSSEPFQPITDTVCLPLNQFGQSQARFAYF